MLYRLLTTKHLKLLHSATAGRQTGEITIEGTDNGVTEVCLHFSLALPAVWETCDTYLKIQPRNFWSRERSVALGPEFLENGNCSVHVTANHSKVPDTSTKYVLNVPPNRNLLP